jgi:hypothetical protein
MHDDAVLTLRGVEGSTDFEEADALRCVPIIGCDWINPPGERAAGDAAATARHGLAALTPAIPKGRAQANVARPGCAQPAGLAFRAAKLSTNADNPGFETTTR